VNINTDRMNEVTSRLQTIEDILQEAEEIESILPRYLVMKAICESAVPLTFMDPVKIDFVDRFAKALENLSSPPHRGPSGQR